MAVVHHVGFVLLAWNHAQIVLEIFINNQTLVEIDTVVSNICNFWC